LITKQNEKAEEEEPLVKLLAGNQNLSVHKLILGRASLQSEETVLFGGFTQNLFSFKEKEFFFTDL
jgi:hypothetical protein